MSKTILPLIFLLTAVVSWTPAAADPDTNAHNAAKNAAQRAHEHQKQDQKDAHEYDKARQKDAHEYDKQQQRDEHEYRKETQRERHEDTKAEQRERHEDAKAEQKRARFRDDQRSAVVRYYRERFSDGRDCPPGLHSRDGRCVAAGRKRYSVGSAIGTTVSLVPIPQDLLITLAAPPPGFAYAFVDGDVVIYEVPMRVVVDVIVAPF